MPIDRPGRGDQGQDGKPERGDQPTAPVDQVKELGTEDDKPHDPRAWRDPRDMLSPEDRARFFRRHEPLTEEELTALEAKNVEECGVPYGWDDDPDDFGDRPGLDHVPGSDQADLRLERADLPHDVVRPRIVGDCYPEVPPTVPERYAVRDPAHPVPEFKGTPIREQTAQGRIGDCGIVSTLGAVAGHQPEAIRNAITKTGEGKYEIRLHKIDPATPRDPVARPTGDTITYRLNDEIPVATDRASRPPAGVRADVCGWPSLMEKAVAAQDQTWDVKQQADWDRAWQAIKPTVDAERRSYGLAPAPSQAPTGYDHLDIGSTPYQRADLLAELTGQEAEVRTMPDEQQGPQALLNEFRTQLADNKPVLVATRGELRGEIEPYPNQGVFAFSHAYEVTKVENDKIYLRNPWGVDLWGRASDPPPMDVRTFWEYYRHYNPDGSRTGHYSTLR